MIIERRVHSPVTSFVQWLIRVIAAILFLVIAAITFWLLVNVLRITWLERDDRVSAAPAGRWLEAGDTRLHAQEWGKPSDPVLMLVHGTGAWSGTWISNVDALVAGGWRVVAIDLPPFGFSERPANRDYSRVAQARRIVAAIQQYGAVPVVLMGHSFGGGPAAEAAMLAPEKIRQLVLLDAAIGLHETTDVCESPTGLAASLLDWRGFRTALVASTAAQPMLTPYFLRQFVARKEAISSSRADIYRVPFTTTDFSEGLGDWGQQFATSCTLDAVTQSATPAGWQRLNVPLTLVWGDKDSITPLQQATRLKELVPAATLSILPGVGHIPQIEDVEQFNRRMPQILATIR